MTNQEALRQIFSQILETKIDYIEGLTPYFNTGILYVLEGKHEKHYDSSVFGGANFNFYTVNNEHGSRANLIVTKTIGDSLPDHLKLGTKLELSLNATKLKEYFETKKETRIANAYVTLNDKPYTISFNAIYDKDYNMHFLKTKIAEKTIGSIEEKNTHIEMTHANWQIEDELER